MRTRHSFTALLAIALLAVLASAPSRAAPATNPRLASLQIEIWPEYDRPQALVILKGELASDAALPATVALRIPASSGGPSAVAYADPSGKLLNLNYERENAGDFVMLRFRTPQRSFHVEFYDPLAPDKRERNYRYGWPGDLAVDQVGVLVKEPAGASNFSVQPALGITTVSPDGLRYRAAQLGALKAGQPLPIEIRYTKTDPRTSVEILGAAAPAASAQRSARPDGWLLALGAGVLTMWAAAGFVWWRRRKRSALRAAGAGFCPKCGGTTTPADRFCASCGAALARQPSSS